ncbi:MAG: hypothetical protein P8N43_12300 [Alphaproteobacteria bacterium]|nr:hypothetical protein [Alphaproteobacteria bacterium]
MTFPFLDLVVSRFRDDPARGAPGAFYLGDSVLERISDTDTDTKALSEMVVAALPTRCIAFSAPSYTPVHFVDYARVLAALPRRPRVVIVPFNIRCLSPQWFANPKYQNLDHRAAIKHFLEHPSGPVPSLAGHGADFPDGPDAQAVERFRALSVSSTFTRAVTVAVLEDRRETPPHSGADARASDLLAYHYGLDLPPTHVCLDALTELVRVLNEIDVQVLIYATPVNVGLGVGIHGEGFLKLLRAKVAAAKAAAGLGGALSFMDFHDLCPPADFLHPDYVVV